MMDDGSTQHVHNMYTTCIQHVHNMHTTCTQHVSEWGGLTGWFQFMAKRRTAFPKSRGERREGEGGKGGEGEEGRGKRSTMLYSPYIHVHGHACIPLSGQMFT